MESRSNNIVQNKILDPTEVYWNLRPQVYSVEPEEESTSVEQTSTTRIPKFYTIMAIYTDIDNCEEESYSRINSDHHQHHDDLHQSHHQSHHDRTMAVFSSSSGEDNIILWSYYSTGLPPPPPTFIRNSNNIGGCRGNRICCKSYHHHHHHGHDQNIGWPSPAFVLDSTTTTTTHVLLSSSASVVTTLPVRSSGGGGGSSWEYGEWMVHHHSLLDYYDRPTENLFINTITMLNTACKTWKTLIVFLSFSLEWFSHTHTPTHTDIHVHIHACGV